MNVFSVLNMHLGALVRACLMFVFIALDISFISVSLKGIANIGSYFGLTVCTALLLVCVFYKRVHALFLSQNRLIRITAYAILALLVLGVILAAAFSCAMIKYANNKPTNPCKTVVVLGCKVNGTAPSLMLYARINAAFDYLTANPEAVCIASGGQGADEDISEAQAIKNALVDMGISESRIYLDDLSVNTEQNLKNAYNISVENGFDKEIAVVTDGFHQMRSQLLAESCGFEAFSVPAKTKLYLLPTYWIREWFALCEFFVFG